MGSSEIVITEFSNQTKADRRLLKRFVDFHWRHYRNDPQYVPLLDYEYLGFKLLGMTGFFEPRNLFLKHAEMRFFLAEQNGEIVGRCNAFVNHNHNKHWNDKIGFFGQFEAIEDQRVADDLLGKSAEWLKARGMDTIRGPQNLPVNEATPGLMTQGFDTRPVIYYHYNKPYYEKLVRNAGFEPIKKVLSWEVPVMNPMEERLERVAKKVIERYDVRIETWGERPFEVRWREMFEIYNDAWSDNFGFVPFTEEEFHHIAKDMMLVMDKGLFIFLYIKGEPAAFFGGIPNIAEKMRPLSGLPRCEWFRAGKMLLTKGGIKGFRLGYLGVKKKFRRLGLDGVMLWKQKLYSQAKGYEYSDLGWTLENNVLVIRLVETVQGVLSKAYTTFQKPIA